jgi:hypothetical protein
VKALAHGCGIGLLSLAACGGGSGSGASPVVDSGVDGGIALDAGDAGARDSASEVGTEGGPPALLSIDCTASNAACPAMTMPPDVPDTAAQSGFADPSMRRDPTTGTLWMSYSNIHTFTESGTSTRVIELHLASSTNEGQGWTYTGTPLFAHAQVTTTADGLGPYPAPYYTSHEVSNLYPMMLGGSVTWAIVYKYYTVVAGQSPVVGPDGGADFTDFTASSMLVLAAGGSTPEGLGTAPSVRLGAAGTQNAVDVNLSSLSPEVASCAQLDEPALMMPGDGKLYLAAFCLPLGASGGVDYPGGSYVLFSTTPMPGDPKAWTWSYVGVLAGPAQAPMLGAGVDYWWELDLAQKQDGTLLAIVTPASDATDEGCEVREIQSLSPPSLGNAPELASITTSDQTHGDACTYEPTSATGVVIFRGPYAVGGGERKATLNATGLRP